MALTIGELVGYLRLNDQGWQRGLSQARREVGEFTRDADGRLRDAAGRFVAEGNAAGDGFARGLDRGFAGSAASMAAVATRMATVTAASTLASTALNGTAAAGVTASGGLLLVPGAAAAGGAALAALAVGTSGFADAITETDPEKYAEALDKLAPSARDTAVAVREMAPAWAQVQQSVQQELFSEMGDVVRQVGGIYLPVLGRGLTGIASSFGIAAAGASHFLMEARTISDVEAILADTETAVGDLGGATQPLLQIFRDVAAVGASYLPQLTAGFGSAAERAAAFIAQARQTGQLAAWIDGALAILSTLGGVAGDVATAVGAIFAAASSGDGNALAMLEQLTSGLAAFLTSAQGSSALQQIFAGLAAAGSGVTSAVLAVAEALLTRLGPVVAGLGPTVGQLASFIGSALVTAIQILSGVLSPVVSLLSGLGGLMGDNAGTVSFLASALGGAAVAIAAVVAISRVWTGVQWALNAAMRANPIGIVLTLLGALVGAIVWAWNNLTWFRDFWTTVWNGLVMAAQPLIDFFTRQVVPRLQQAWAMISAGLGRFAVWFGEVWNTQIMPKVRPVVDFFLAEVVPRLQQAWDFIITGVQAFTAWFGQIWRSGLGDTVIGVVSAAWNTVVDIIGGALAFIQGNLNFFIGIFTGDWSQAWFGARQILDGAMGAIRAAVQGGIDFVLSIIRNLPGAIWAIVSTAGSWLVQTGRDMVTGLINGLRQLGGKIGEVLMGFARQAWQQVKSFFGIASPSKLMMGAGVNIGQGLAIGIASQAGIVDRAFADMATTPRVPAAVLPAPLLAAPIPPPQVAAPAAVAYRPPPPPGTESVASAANPVGDARASVHIDQFHATPQQTPGDIARELDWLSRGRG
ncbi:hypothetical protein AB0L13_11425 [Saccharopolyspora shandongensis]|uniref:phage tail protein n=1 Tax=Saccharopolyspora shandongensis TaxID=418495 RepID=UPI00343B4F65